MLKIKTMPARLFLLLAFGPLLAVASILVAVSSVFLIVYADMFTGALIGLISPIILLCQVINNGWKNTFQGNVNIALFANSRTLAIVPLSGNIKYIKRRDCQTAFGNFVQLSDENLVRLGWVEFSGPRLRGDFLRPLYSGWCPSYTREEIERHLTPWVARQVIPLLVGLPITLTLVLAGLALTDWNVAILLILTSVPLVIAGLMMWHAMYMETSGPPTPERLRIARSESGPLATGEFTYAED